MERFLVLAILLFSCRSFAALPVTGSPTIALDSWTTNAGKSSISPDQLSSGLNIFSLYGGDFGASFTAGNFSPLFKNGRQYIVTTGKSAYCFNMTGTANLTQRSYQLVSSTAQFTWNAASITGAIYQAGMYGKVMIMLGAAGAVVQPVAGTYVFGSASWPGFETDSGTATLWSIHMDCYEF